MDSVLRVTFILLLLLALVDPRPSERSVKRSQKEENPRMEAERRDFSPRSSVAINERCAVSRERERVSLSPVSHIYANENVAGTARGR